MRAFTLALCAQPTPHPHPPAGPQAYIDFEIGEGNREGARELYERLLQRTRHVKASWVVVVVMCVCV